MDENPQSPKSLTPGPSANTASRLKLQTIGPANLAYLKCDSKGRVFLYFRGLLYGVDDYVPTSLIRSQSISPAATAGEFVCRQMLSQYGEAEDAWPDVARHFLLQHRPPRSARRDAPAGRDIGRPLQLQSDS